MRGIFDIDSPVMRAVIKFFDCICASILWLLFSLPAVTAGASSTALYVTVHHYLRREEGHLLKTFLTAFRDNFKRSTLIWLAALPALGIFAVDALVFRSMAIRGEPLGRLYWLSLLLCCAAVTWVVYLFAYAARFNGTVRDVLRFGLLLMILHPIRALGVFLSVFAGALLVMIGPGLIAIVPTVVCWLVSITLERVFLLHMRPEDAAKENRDGSNGGTPL